MLRSTYESLINNSLAISYAAFIDPEDRCSVGVVRMLPF